MPSPTSFCNFRERQTRASLQIDIIGIDEGAQRAERFAGKEVRLGSLYPTV